MQFKIVQYVGKLPFDWHLYADDVLVAQAKTYTPLVFIKNMLRSGYSATEEAGFITFADECDRRLAKTSLQPLVFKLHTFAVS